MGRVFKARDPRLNRLVALKLIRGDDPDLIRRLVREAQAQARIAHDNICNVYEVGEVGGHPYIAMQYIAGEPLRDAKRWMTLEQKVEVTLKVAEALHAAHRTGLIHRDIKPANIMIERDAEGVIRPYVMDFGLAREVEGGGHTMTGTIEGTPAYMAPEQARGETSRLDRRTDVYSLGATLYELLGGRPPFHGASGLDILLALVNDEPEPVRKVDASVPADLETITMKCLEKDPSRRYDSAKALADDLRRYLDGEPIQARPAGLGYLIRKKAKKHKLVVAIGAAALVSTAVLGGAGVRARMTAAEQARLAQQLGQDVTEMETFLRIAYLLPLHDTRPERAAVRRRMAAIEEQMARVGPLGEGPGRYALARGHMALHEHREALSELEKAWGSGYRSPDVAYAMGQVLGEIYREGAEDARKIGDKTLVDDRLKELEEAFLKPALRYLAESEGARGPSKAYVEGLIAFYSRRHDEALLLAQRAFSESPWLYEAKKLEGDVYRAEGDLRKDRGEYREALGYYTKAGDAFRTAADIARSDAAIHDAESAMRFDAMGAEIPLGISPMPSFTKAIEASDRWLVADPENAKSNERRAYAYWRIAHHALAVGEDPSAWLDKGLAEGREATRRDPKNAAAWHVLGIIYALRARFEWRQGRDAWLTLDLAIKSHQSAVETDPSFAWGWNDLGNAIMLRAIHEMARGQDPHASMRESVEVFGSAIRVSPRYAYPYSNTCYALSLLARYEISRGVDPRPTLELGAKPCRDSLELNPGLAINPALAQLVLAEYELKAEQDPRPTMARCAETLSRVLKLNPKDIEALVYTADIAEIEAEHLAAKGEDPGAALSKGSAAVQQIIDITTRESLAYLSRARLALVAARWAKRGGKDVTPHLDQAEADLLRAAELEPGNAEIHGAAAEVYLRRAAWAGKERARRIADIERGLAMIEKALSINTTMPRFIALKGALHLEQARDEQRAPERRELARRAEESLDKGIRENALLRSEFEPSLEEARRLAANP
jgi:serine/threonine-protein kinase